MARKKQVAEVAEADLEQVDAGGLGIDEGIVLATSLLLIGAIVIVYLANQNLLAG
ncbi:MAG: hypothetical protein AB7O97_21980 [Planctomycetota bacterium]